MSAYIEANITEDNIQFYQKNGYLIWKNAFDAPKISSLIAETEYIFKGERGNVEGLDNDGLSESEILKKYAAIHFPHKISEFIKGCASDKTISDVLSQIVSPNVKCMQTMLFMKAPGKNGQSWHQDEYYIPTSDKSLIGAWIAIDDADLSNGCLHVIPGSHNDGFIRKRIDNQEPEFADIDVADISPYTEKDFVPVEVPSGSIVFFHGYLLHMSKKNKTEDKYRRALVCHYSSAETMLPWDQDGRLDHTADMRDIFMLCGKDPYGHVGTTNLSQPFVRPDVLTFNTDKSREQLKQRGWIRWYRNNSSL